MERFVKGDVVVLPFPYSDLSASKKRPATPWLPGIHFTPLEILLYYSNKLLFLHTISLKETNV